MAGSSWWRLFNPSTLYGILEFIHSSPFSKSNFDPNFVIAQLVFFFFCISLAVIAAVWTRRFSPMLITIVSPFTIGTYVDVQPTLHVLQQFLERCKINRTAASPIAVSTLQERIQNGRAIRNARFDLYLPPLLNSQSSSMGSDNGLNGQREKPSQPGLILLPGAFVDHTSYAQIAALVSDGGTTVAVVSAEPWRLPTTLLGTNMSTICSVARHSSQICMKKKMSAGTFLKTLKWHIGGHSMGGYAAMDLMNHIERNKLSVKRKRQQTQHLFSNARLVVWGSGSFLDLIPQFRANPELKCLFIFGENDLIAKPSRNCFDCIRCKIPQAQIAFRTILGGSHNGFASYPSDPIVSGVQGITLENQHDFTASLTNKFLTTKDHFREEFH